MGAVRRVIAAVLIASIGLFVACSKPAPPAPSAPLPAPVAPTLRAVVAVLPLAAEDTLADGMARHFARVLGQQQALAVISPESAFRFRDSSELNSVIGEKLGATHLLRGTLQRSDGTLTLAVELIQTADGSTLWQQHYQRTEKEVFALQDEVLQSVAQALQLEPLDLSAPDDRPPSKRLAAYQQVLEGEQQLQGIDVFSIQSAVKAFQAALQSDPQYAYASARLSMARVRQLQQFPALYSGQMERERAQAKQEAEAALQRAPNLPEAHWAMSVWLADLGSSPALGLQEMQKAVALRPSDAALQSALAVRQIGFGKLDAALETLRVAIKYNPLSPGPYYTLGSVYLGLANYEQAEHEFEQALALEPKLPLAHAFLAMAVFQQGRSAEAIKMAQQEPEALWRHYALAMAYWVNGERAASDRELQVLIDEHASEAATQIAGVYAQRDDEESMFRWLDVARQARDPGLMEIRYMPYISRYSSDARFTAILRELGFAP
ncbi:MAG: tetratricopeptide repeat protein [Thermomonas sp.]|uniref:tetratricopeptide repeat protein n=1 Tax=Thermomonas sp. TaxID=1971895 RepID=UPI001EC7E7F4|nr:tetratricopeptide repeat protein [Thermomonas sp.]MBV2209801.1 tetratricopeptide repeat protein [Thermomonas sp.]